MILNDLLSSDGFTPVNKKLAKDLGFIVAGYFGELIRQRKRFGQEEFYYSQSQMTEEIGISEHEQRQAVKKLKEIGFITIEKKGLPAKYHFKINDELVIEYFNYQCSKIGSTSDGKNEAQNKNNNKKENKNNNIISNDIIEAEASTLSKPKETYGNEEINSLLQIIKNNNDGLCAGTVPEQRRYGKLLLGKLKQFTKSGYDPLESLDVLLQKLDGNQFYGPKKVGPKDIYYNFEKLIQVVKSEIQKEKKEEKQMQRF